MIKSLISYFQKRLQGLDEHTLEVVKKSSASTVVKVIGMAIGLLVSVFLGRTIGADGLGIINLSNRIVNILIIVGLLGMRQVIIKEVAIAHNKKDFGHIGNVMHTAYWLNGAITLVLSVILIFLSPWISNTVFNEPRLQYPLMVALIVMTPQVFSRVFSSALVGYRKIWQSNLVQQTLSIAITGIVLGIISLLKLEITIKLVAVCYAIGRVGVTVSVGLYWKTLYHFKSKRKVITKQLLKTSIPLFFVSISGIVMTNTDAIILGVFTNSKSIGLYTVAVKIAMLTSFFLQVTNASVAPKIAFLYAESKLDELERMVQKVTMGLSVFGLISMIVFLVFGRSILSVWGDEFTSAYWILIILSFGQFVSIASGAVNNLLVMTNNEVIVSKIHVFFMFLAIFLGVPLIYYFGIIGAAITTTIIVVGENLTKIIIVKSKIGISTLRFLNKKINE